MALPSGRSRFHQLDKLVEQRCHIMGAWAGFRVTLEAVGRLVGAANALQGAVKQRLVGGFHIGRQGCFVYRSEERRVGKECSFRCSPSQAKDKFSMLTYASSFSSARKTLALLCSIVRQP